MNFVGLDMLGATVLGSDASTLQDIFSIVHPIGGAVLSAFGAGGLAQPLGEWEKQGIASTMTPEEKAAAQAAKDAPAQAQVQAQQVQQQQAAAAAAAQALAQQKKQEQAAQPKPPAQTQTVPQQPLQPQTQPQPQSPKQQPAPSPWPRRLAIGGGVVGAVGLGALLWRLL